MPVSIKELQENVGKQVVLHVMQEDGTLKELVGEIKAANEAGIPFKQKGRSGLDLYTVEEIEEVGPAPIKAKSVTQKKLKPVERGAARQHLLDRHGVQLSWAKSADEEQAFEYHEGLDHSDLGHRHEATKVPTEDSSES